MFSISWLSVHVLAGLIDHSAPQRVLTATLCPRWDWDPSGSWQVLEGELCNFWWSFTPLKGRQGPLVFVPVGQVHPIGCLWDILQIKIEELMPGLCFQRNPNCSSVTAERSYWLFLCCCIRTLCINLHLSGAKQYLEMLGKKKFLITCIFQVYWFEWPLYYQD